MHYKSNERNYLPLSAGIHHSEDKHENKEMYKEMYFLNFKFSIVHVSTNNIIRILKFCMHVCNIDVEGTVSQILISTLRFYFI